MNKTHTCCWLNRFHTSRIGALRSAVATAIALVLGTAATASYATQALAGLNVTSATPFTLLAQPRTVGSPDSDNSEQASVVFDVGDDRPDRDADGIANQDDLDDDNDTILDTEEGIIDADGNGVADANSRDSDGDGIPDGNDLDSDNDGILDILEGRLDQATVDSFGPVGSGAIDINVPVGSNGLPDVLETSPDSNVLIGSLRDTDGDGTPNYIDIDSDNDGIADLVEAGGGDVNADGRIDGFTDADSKGVDDAIQASALPLFDTDGDGQRDDVDSDSDNDSLPDFVEGAGNLASPTDSDGDGAGDYREQDSDNDGVSDTVEAGQDPYQPIDSNGDGIADYQDAAIQYTGSTGPDTPDAPEPGADHDGDGIADVNDDDDDNDGIADIAEGEGDSDSDGVLDRLDRDSDNDGIYDSAESDIDTDGDSIPDYKDLDSDNDGAYDAHEAGRVNITSHGRLASAVHVDAFGQAAGASEGVIDTDSDAVPDRVDLDSDNDGLTDAQEGGYSDNDLDGRIDPFVDSNNDGAHDAIAGVSTHLLDTDADRVPDIRDLDSDQDGLSDVLENHGSGFDLDNDGRIDNFTDGNADGLDDNIAAHLMPLTDRDNDGLANSADLDSDGDGVSDLVEAGGVDTDNNGLIDVLADADGDGVPDVNDVNVTGGSDADGDSIDDQFDRDFVAGNDSDHDGIVDAADPDSDGNGFAGPLADDTSGLLQGQPVTLPDNDGDGVPDFEQGAALSGMIETGLNGSGFGCSIAPAGSGDRPDPMLMLLLSCSLLLLTVRARQRRIATAAVIAGSAAALSGCGVLDTAASDKDFNSRVYAGVGVLGSQVEPDTDGVAGTKIDESKSAGGSVTLGYDISNRFSIEGHLADLGEASLDPSGTIGYKVGGISGLVYGLNEVSDRDDREGFSVFGKLGLGTMSNDAQGVEYKRLNDVHMLAGVGMEYGLSNGLAVRAELLAHETDAKYAQLGIVYRFDRADHSNAAADKVDVVPAVELTGDAINEADAVLVEAAPIPQDVPLIENTAPMLDGDSDGIVDAADQCPDTATGQPVKDDGCALFDGVIEGLNFKTGSATLTASAAEVLDNIAQTLQDYPDVRVAIEAHTDNQGTEAANMQLSKRRAIAVSTYLINHGVRGSRLKPEAYGESQPRSNNETAEQRASNRRVEFSVLD